MIQKHDADPPTHTSLSLASLARRLYGVFNRLWPGPATPKTVVFRVVASFITSPFVNAAFFTYGAAFPHLAKRLSGETSEVDWKCIMNEAGLKIRNDLISVVKMSATLWVPVNFANFYFVPPHLTIITTNCFSVLWSFYLSLVQFKKKPLLDKSSPSR